MCTYLHSRLDLRYLFLFTFLIHNLISLQIVSLADGKPVFADTTITFMNFDLTQSLFAFKDIAYKLNDTTNQFFTKYPLNVITEVSYLTFVDLNTGISAEIKEKLRMSMIFNCMLGSCNYIINSFKSGLVDVIITYEYVYKNGKLCDVCL